MRQNYPRYSGVYVHHDDDPQAHADYVLDLMGRDPPVNGNEYIKRKDDSDDYPLVEYIFIRPPEKMWRTQLKYVRTKSGEKRFVPVSCSKNCSKCGGCSPGCGKNFEFQQIKDDFDPLPEIWIRLRSKPSETDPFIEYIILYI
jgi:hypothetical protein